MSQRPPPPELRKARVDRGGPAPVYVMQLCRVVQTWGDGHGSRQVFDTEGEAVFQYHAMSAGGDTLTLDYRLSTGGRFSGGRPHKGEW